MRLSLALAVVATAMSLTGCADDPPETIAQPQTTATSSTGPSASGSPEAQQLPPLPEGWRWESYRDLVVGVPGDWAFTGGRISDWCASTGEGPPEPGVGRPGPVMTIGCPQPSPGEPDPGSLLRNGGTFLAFTSADRSDLRTEGDREVLTIGTTAVVIQADEELRAQIAETLQQRNDTDHNRCPLTHPVSADPAWRPSPVDPATLADVTAMTACRYDLRSARNELPADAPTLVSSVRVTGERARSTAAAIAAAPDGGGPDDPSSCVEDASYGDEAVVVRLDHSGRAPDYLVVRYSGCNHNGIDDGRSVHPLTPADAGAFFEGSNYVTSFSGGDDKAAVLHPEPRETRTSSPEH